MEKNVKVYFEESGDIRRFLLRSATQQELFKQLGDAVGSFWTESGKSFDMMYKDEENDLIKLSTPQEFEVCASCPNNREILRIFVRKSNAGIKSAESASSATNNAVWKHVTCDKCGAAPIQGIRYKCILCPDYDECAKCFRTSPQHQHSMLALNDPNSEEWKAWLRHGSRRFGHHHGGAPGGPAGHRGVPRRCGSFGFGGAEGLPNLSQSMFQPWMKPYADAAKQFAEQLTRQSSSAAGTSAAAAAAAGMPGVSISTCESGHPKVEVDVDMNDLLTQPENVFQTVCRAVEEVGKMVNQSMAATQQQQSTSSQTVKAATEDKKEGTNDVQQQQQDAEMQDNSNVTVGVSTVPPTVEEPKDEKKVSTGSATASGTQTPRTETAAPNGWTLLSEAVGGNDVVSVCIENLKELGFDTEKAWLRDLVKQCQGNLNRVMDELTPGANLRF